MNDLFEEIRRRQRKMFEDFYWPRFSWPRLGWGESPQEKELMKFEVPAEDIRETDKEVVVAFDLPGIDKKDIKLKVAENEIEVKAEKKEEIKEERKGFFRQERSYQGFYRKSSLPAKVKPDQVEAEYKDGVLTVKMPKKEIEHKKPKEVEVKIK